VGRREEGVEVGRGGNMYDGRGRRGGRVVKRHLVLFANCNSSPDRKKKSSQKVLELFFQSRNWDLRVGMI